MQAHLAKRRDGPGKLGSRVPTPRRAKHAVKRVHQNLVDIRRALVAALDGREPFRKILADKRG